MKTKFIKQIAIAISLLICFLLGYITIEINQDYGWFLFIFIPFLFGFLPPYIIGRTREISAKESNLVGFTTLGIACLCALAFAIEGIICITMAAPLMATMTWLGAYLGYKANSGKFSNPTNTLIVLIGCSIAFLSFDHLNKGETLIPVRTKIIVEAPIERAWEKVVRFNKIDEPRDWIFTTGISYPTDATIEGEGIGAIRYCNFSTGAFVEPITTWNEPNLLQFNVVEQPIPMNEFNPFWDIHPPHLDGYFRSYKGQFKLTRLSENKTEIEGTTWYKVDIHPEFYWKAWSDFIIHRIHKRVLNHIKKEVEK